MEITAFVAALIDIARDPYDRLRDVLKDPKWSARILDDLRKAAAIYVSADTIQQAGHLPCAGPQRAQIGTAVMRSARG